MDVTPYAATSEGSSVRSPVVHAVTARTDLDSPSAATPRSADAARRCSWPSELTARRTQIPESQIRRKLCIYTPPDLMILWLSVTGIHVATPCISRRCHRMRSTDRPPPRRGRSSQYHHTDDTDPLDSDVHHDMGSYTRRDAESLVDSAGTPRAALPCIERTSTPPHLPLDVRSILQIVKSSSGNPESSSSIVNATQP